MQKRIITSLIFTLLLSVVFANVSLAAIGLDPNLHPKGAPTISGNMPEDEIGQTVNDQRLALTRRITNLVFGIASIVAVFFVVQNGWSMAASAGAEEKLTQAKKGLTWAAIGLLLIILSYSIIRFVITTTFQTDEGNSAPAAAAPGPGEGSLQGVPSAGDVNAPAQPQPASPIPQPQGEPVPENSSAEPVV